MSRINLTDEQIEAIAEAGGFEASEVWAAVRQANANTGDETETPAEPDAQPEEERRAPRRPAAPGTADDWLRAQLSR